MSDVIRAHEPLAGGAVMQGVWLVVVVLFGLFLSPHPLAALDKSTMAAHGTITAGNGFYSVHVQDISGLGIGRYTVTTGPLHPVGNGLNVLFGNGFPGTSYNTVRSYTTNTDYSQRTGVSSPNPVVWLDPFGNAVPLGSTGVRTTYSLPGPPTTPDTLTIVQDVNVNGSTFANSTVEVTTRITNGGSAAVLVGLRYLWDVQIGADDGPSFQPQLPPGPVFVTEAEFRPPTFGAFRIEDNGVNPSPPTFNVFGTVSGPPTIVPSPTTPDLLQFVCWVSAVGEAFEYTVNPSLDCSTGGRDSAVLYFFGSDQMRAVSIGPGETRSFSASLFLNQPGTLQLRPQAAPALSAFGLSTLSLLLAGLGLLALPRKRPAA
jgi:hypothetical protein